MIPERIEKGIEKYVVHHIPQGHFLTACLENNLAAAYASADAESREALGEIVKYLHNEVPLVCWGSKEKVAAWLRNRVEEEVKK